MNEIKYTPFVPSAMGCSAEFAGDTAAEVAEKIIDNPTMRYQLKLVDSAAGYVLHAIRLTKAVMTSNGLSRALIIDIQGMPTVPQSRAGETNPIKTKTIYL